jgi:hypothetical protein
MTDLFSMVLRTVAANLSIRIGAFKNKRWLDVRAPKTSTDGYAMKLTTGQESVYPRWGVATPLLRAARSARCVALHHRGSAYWRGQHAEATRRGGFDLDAAID